MTTQPDRPLQPGDRAPDFTLPAANREGSVSLADYRGKQAALIGLYRGLHCPFCRRQVVQLGAVQEKLQALGVETLAIVNTQPERARMYYRYRPTRATVLADPGAGTHLAFGIPRPDIGPDVESRWPAKANLAEFAAVRLNPTGELAAPMPIFEASAELNRRDGFEATDADNQIMASNPSLLTGHFLVDRAGIVRWAQVEGSEGMNDLARYPSGEELVAAARAVVG